MEDVRDVNFTRMKFFFEVATEKKKKKERKSFRNELENRAWNLKRSHPLSVQSYPNSMKMRDKINDESALLFLHSPAQNSFLYTCVYIYIEWNWLTDYYIRLYIYQRIGGEKKFLFHITSSFFSFLYFLSIVQRNF